MARSADNTGIKMLLVNRKLKKIAARAGLTTPLTMYVARHSWASIAKTKNISIGIISEAMGHDSENYYTNLSFVYTD